MTECIACTAPICTWPGAFALSVLFIAMFGGLAFIAWKG